MARSSIFRRITMWSEAVAAICLVLLSDYYVAEVNKIGVTRFLGRQSEVILRALSLVPALAFGLAAVALRPTSSLGWYAQVFPVAVVLSILYIGM
jgi:hypothetical protein